MILFIVDLSFISLAKPIVQFDLSEGRFSAQEASLYARRNDTKDFAEKILLLLDDQVKRKTMGDFGRNRIITELEWKYEEPKLLEAYRLLFL